MFLSLSHTELLTCLNRPAGNCESQIAEIAAQVRGEIDGHDVMNPDFEVIPYALDRAIRKLRDSEVPFSSWIPFIHIGY